MRLEQSFEVPVPVAQAWSVLLDLTRVAPCVPGATLTSFDGTSFTGSVGVKLGPISLAYRGQGRITDKDESGHRVAFIAQGQDTRGAGGASARVSAVLHSTEAGAATLVRVVADLDITGKAAQFGRSLVAEVSTKVIKQFAENLAATIGSSRPAYTPSYAPAPAYAPAASIPAQAAPVDAIAPAAPPPVFESTPVFEPLPPATPAAPSYSPASPDYPPAAPAYPSAPSGWEPTVTDADYVPPTPAYSAPPSFDTYGLRNPEPAPTPQPPATPAPTDAPEAGPAETPAASPAPEAEPGTRGVLRRAAPVLIIVALALIGLVVWLVAFRNK